VVEGIKVLSKFIGSKNLIVHRSCKTLIEGIYSYAWDAAAAARGEDKPSKVKDHILDAMRYAIFSAFPSGEMNRPEENLTIEQIKRQIYGSDDSGYAAQMLGLDQSGYF